MIRRFRSLLILLLLCGLALVSFAPAVPEATAQSDRQRREDGDNGGGRGEGRGRRFGRGGEDGGEGRGFGRDRGRGRGSENSDGERFQRPSGSSGATNSERPASSSGSSSNMSMDDYVRSLVKQHDKDGDMILRGDELKGLSGKAASADLNKDGSITTNELATTLSGNAPASTAGSRSESSSGGEGSSSDSSESGERGSRGERRRDRERGGDSESSRRAGAEGPTRVYTALPAGGKAAAGSNKTDKVEAKRTYRFSTGSDRLPSSGLPSWFKSKDSNGDGQVEMNEYSRTWSERMVSEFHRYDLDNDGIVTAKEAAEKK